MSVLNKLALALCAALLLQAPVFAADAKQEANKKLVLEFYERCLNQKDYAAAAQFIGPRYTQHNPGVVDGVDGFTALVKLVGEKYPLAHTDIKRVFTDGDFVILHVHSVAVPGARGSAGVDIFRVDGGKIVEHWDVGQAIPEKSLNSNTMF